MTAQSMWFQGISALQSREFLRRSDSGISKSIERLSTGLRINSAEDDPAGLHLSRAGYANRMGRIQAALENVQMGINFMDLRYEGLINSREALMRIRDIAVRSANDAVITDDQRVGMQDEVDGLLEAIDNNRNIMFRMDSSSGEGSKVLFDPGQLDVVWIVDQTASMGIPINYVYNGADPMCSALKSKGFDLQMGAVGFGTANVSIFTPVGAPPGTAINAITATGTRSLQSDVTTFKQDLDDIRNNFQGSRERGMDATMEGIWGTGIIGQLNSRPNAQRVVILLTDADSDDNGEFGANPAMNTIQSQRDYVVNALDSISASFYVVSTITEGGGPFAADVDYTDIASRVATSGGSTPLDAGGAWVNTITATLQGYGGPWDMRFHYGPDSDGWFEYTLDTVVPATMSISGLDVSTALTAQNSITRVDSAVEFLSNALQKTGYLRGLLDRIITSQESEYINLAQVNSNIMDADMAAEIANYTKETLVQNAAVSMMANSNSAKDNLISLIENNLTQDFSITPKQQA